MDDICAGKRKKSFRKNSQRLHKEKPKVPKLGESSGKATSNVLTCLKTTEKSYEKQMSRNKITQGRITTRPGLFNQGKCTSFVQRALYLSPNKKARMDEDLHRIIQLANGVPNEKLSHCNILERSKDVSSNYGVSVSNSNSQGGMDICSDTEIIFESFGCSSSQESSKCCCGVENFKSQNPNHPEYELLKTMDKYGKSGSRNKPVYKLSASSSSNGSSQASLEESIAYSSPTLEEYEEFIASAVLTIESKKMELFTGRDFLKETRDRITAKFHQNLKNGKLQHQKSNGGFGGLMSEPCPSSDAFSHLTRLPFEDSQSVRINDKDSPARDEQYCSELSPFPCILSPKTTILNPIEYLKRIEQGNKQNEKPLNDSGLESGLSWESSFSNSQNKANMPYETRKNVDSHHLSLESDVNCHSSQNPVDNLVYRHSNRSYIDSPQAFKLQESNIRFPNKLSSNPLCGELLAPQNNVDIVAPRKHLNTEIEQNIPGVEYLMDISEIALPSVNYNDCSDLLDELDAIDGNLVSHSNLASTNDRMRLPLIKKQWGPPPTPPTPEHKFYRRKMF